MPLLPDDSLTEFDPAEYSEDVVYYLGSKVQSGFFKNRFFEGVEAWVSDPEARARSFSSFKTYPGRPRTLLAPDLKDFRRLDWEQTVLARHSSRAFIDQPVDFSRLSNLFVLSCGLKERGRWLGSASDRNPWPARALPSGGAMYPLEFYVLALNVKGLGRGLYHLNQKEGVLELLRDDDETFQLDRFWAQKRVFGHPAAIIYVAAVFERTRVKYGPRALRYVLLEAGGVGTHMNLTAGAMGLGFCFDGGGYENQIEELIGIDGRDEGLVTSFLVGPSRDPRR